MIASVDTRAMSSVSAGQAQSTAHYINAFLDLVEEVPNEVQRHLSQLHHLNSTYLRIVDRTEHVVHKYKLVVQALAVANGFCPDRVSLTRSQLTLSKKLETQLIQIQELSDEKLRYSQMISDLIETKAKELDLDYEEVIRFSGKMLDNKSFNSSNKSNATTVQSGSASKTEPNDKKKEEVEDSAQVDKRWLPRRACAVRNGQISEAADNSVSERSVGGHLGQSRPTSGRVVANKSLKGKNFTKSHSFGLSMSTFYRQMARRRAKQQLPQKANKISAKSSRHSAQSKARSKENSNYNKSETKAKSEVTGGHTSNQQVVRRKNAITSSRSSESDSSSDTGSVSKGINGCENKNSNHRKRGQSVRRDASKRRSASHRQNSSSSKKSKSSAEMSAASGSDHIYYEPVDPIDPNEPTYCLCSQVSFGQMICCDNERCAIEWFHFPCVGLDPKAPKPKGKWYCPHCRKAPRLESVAKHRTN